MKLFHISHTDLDGYGCQLITKEYFKEGFFYNANYGLEVKLSIKKVLEQVLEYKEDEILILISDLNLTFQEAKDLEEEIASLKEIAKKLDKAKIVMKKKLGQNGHLFGSITKDEIAHALKEQHNIEIDKKHITDKTIIKTTGEHSLDLKLGHLIHATIHVDVVGE